MYSYNKITPPNVNDPFRNPYVLLAVLILGLALTIRFFERRAGLYGWYGNPASIQHVVY